MPKSITLSPNSGAARHIPHYSQGGCRYLDHRFSLNSDGFEAASYGEQWHVAYGLLHRVLDGSTDNGEILELEILHTEIKPLEDE